MPVSVGASKAKAGPNSEASLSLPDPDPDSISDTELERPLVFLPPSWSAMRFDAAALDDSTSGLMWFRMGLTYSA